MNKFSWRIVKSDDETEETLYLFYGSGNADEASFQYISFDKDNDEDEIFAFFADRTKKESSGCVLNTNPEMFKEIYEVIKKYANQL